MALPVILKSILGNMLGVSHRGALVLNAFGRPATLVGQTPVVLAAGTALTASSTETSLGKYTIPKNTLHAGTVIKVKFQGICTATNGSDTFQHKLYIGGLLGTAILTGTATDVANNNVFVGEATVVIRTNGASGTLVGCGSHSIVPAATAVAVPVYEILASTAVDTTVDLDVMLSGKWSSTNAGNSCRLDILAVEIA